MALNRLASNQTEQFPWGIRVRIAIGALVVAMCLPGCLFRKDRLVGLPQRHSIAADQLLVMSDFRLESEHPLVLELKQLRHQVTETLQLPEKTEKVIVYLFDDETQYRKYMEGAYPGLPFRRAYFIGTPDELAVYTFWGPRIREDLRHEYTHGLLHAALRHVPLWLDEGLAEYFEVPGPEPGTVNVEYANRLATAVTNGWRPDMHRLERLERVDQMHRADYREAWAWVHLLLRSTPDAKQVLLDYLNDLRANPRPEKLSEVLLARFPEADTRLLNHMAQLTTFRNWMTNTPPVNGSARREPVRRAAAP